MTRALQPVTLEFVHCLFRSRRSTQSYRRRSKGPSRKNQQDTNKNGACRRRLRRSGYRRSDWIANDVENMERLRRFHNQTESDAIVNPEDHQRAGLLVRQPNFATTEAIADGCTVLPNGQYVANCKAVVASAGFTLMTEALHLRKPMLALPMKGQFEQELNGLLLEDLGAGKNCPEVEPSAVGDFLYRLPEYREKLAGNGPAGGSEICAKLDELLADGCALASDYHRRRVA